MDLHDEIMTVAADYLIDPADATTFAPDEAQFVDAEGKFNRDALEGHLKNLVAIKPYLKKPEPVTVDYRTASREEFELALAEYGVSLRSGSHGNPYFRR
jgi:hypothetical protein